ncbi:MAG: Na/Pi cotransporter family protein [Oscillospiraceae bacterium]|nr:Na/Pi cotransporter family protein [Oscillospiraceae bacterium]
MTVTDALGLLGGLGMFLFGMNLMSSGLEAAAGEKMKKLMEKLTDTTLKGVLVGTIITALIQSSSATTVMLVGFVNSGLMTLSQTVGIIMGANIGATLNGVLLAVGVGELAPLIIFVGAALIMFSKKEKIKQYGNIIIGLGILFQGMNMMSGSMAGLRSSPAFIHLITTFENPIIGVLVGTVFTAIIQSSSATVGILESLAIAGLITLDNGIYVMFGATMGTCITAAIASIGTGVNAKRVAIIHLLFNIIGTVVFVAICLFFPFVPLVQRMFPSSVSVQIANAHVIFKIVTTILLFPFANWMVKFSEAVLKDKSQDNQRLPIYERAKTMAGYSVGNSAIAISLIREEANYMFDIVRKNLSLSFDALLNGNDEKYEEIHENEREIDKLNHEISRYISSVIANKMPARDSVIISGYFDIIGNIERIGDHAMNFADHVKFTVNQNISFSDRAMGEIKLMQDLSEKAMELIVGDKRREAQELLVKVSKAEQKMDDMTESYRTAQMERMKTTTCSPEASIIYAQMLTDFERIGDHLLNIAEEFAKMYAQ